MNSLKTHAFLCFVGLLGMRADASDGRGSELLGYNYPEKLVSKFWQSLSHLADEKRTLFQKVPQLSRAQKETSHNFIAAHIQQTTSGINAINIVGSDDRIPSNDPRIGRIFPKGCTGWLMSCGFVLTAGHCAYSEDDRLKGMQFFESNVPASELDGRRNNPNAKYRYRIMTESITWFCPADPYKNPDGNRGLEYCLFSVVPYEDPITHIKTTVFEGQKTSGFRLMRDWGLFSATPLIRITGYGLDKQPPGSTGQNNTKSETQQTHTGPITGEISDIPNNKDELDFSVDTLGGNSGSSILIEGSHMVMGIYTHVLNVDGSALGTGFKNNKLVNDITLYTGTGDPAPDSPCYVDADYFATVTNGDGTLLNPFRTLEMAVVASASGKTLGITAGYYANGGIKFPLGKKLILKAFAGKVYIGGVELVAHKPLPPINPPSLTNLSPVSLQYRDITSSDHGGVPFHLAVSMFPAKKEVIRKDIGISRQVFLDPRDTRVLSNDARVGRIIYKDGKFFYPIAIGTGYLISNGCILTSGNVFDTQDKKDHSIFEVNINTSSFFSGDIVEANPQDQYNIISKSIQSGTNVSVDSWTVFRVELNDNTKKTVFESQRFSFRIMKDWYVKKGDGTINPNILFGTNSMVRMTGYGKSVYVDGNYTAKTYIQQTNAAAIDPSQEDTSNGDAIPYTITASQDVGFGSPMYFIGTHMVIGINAQFSPGGTGIGAGFKNAVLVATIKNCFNFPPPPSPLGPLTYVDSDYFAVLHKSADGTDGTDGTGDIFAPYRNLEDAVNKSASGSNLGMVAGYYANAGITFPLGKKLILKAISGKVYIGGILPKPGQQPPFGDTLTTVALNNKNKKNSASVIPIEEPSSSVSSTSSDEDIFSLLGDFGFPIGSVLDWWNTDISSMPACFELCNGQRVLDRESPFFGQYLPNLNHVFARGTIDPGEVGQQGGHSKAVVSLTTSENGQHRHRFMDNRGMTDLTSSVTTAQDIYMNERSAATSNNHGSWTYSRESGSSSSHRKGKEMNHRHSLPETDSGGAHTHTITATVDIHPAYINVLKIVRIK